MTDKLRDRGFLGHTVEGCSCRQFFAGIDCVLGEATLADAGRLIKLYRGVVPPLSRVFFSLAEAS